MPKSSCASLEIVMVLVPNVRSVNIVADNTLKMTEEFCSYLMRLDAESFMGVARVLNIPIARPIEVEKTIEGIEEKVMGRDIEMREFSDVWSEIVECYASLGREPRKQLLRVARKAVIKNGKR